MKRMQRTLNATAAAGGLVALALLAAGRLWAAAGFAVVFLAPAVVYKLLRASRQADAMVAEYRAAASARTANPAPKENNAA
jgi:hypothetical protein